MRRVLSCVALVALLLLSCSVLARYNVTVTKASAWPAAAGKIAILPAMCPSDFDCVWLNEVLGDYVDDEDYPFVAGPEQVAQAMLDAGVEVLEGEGARIVAEMLGADSFLVTVVGNAESRDDATMAVPAFGGGFLMGSTQRAQGGVEIRVVTAEGKSLARGSGFGESSFKKERRVAGKVFEQLIDELVSD